MNNESISLNPPGSFVCVISFMILAFSIICLPAKDIIDNISPVIKGPRPYKTNLDGLAYLNDGGNRRISKKESSFYPIIIKAADKHDVDPALIKAIIKAESRYNPMATSKKGAVGLMQIMPQTAATLGMEDMYNPVHNINAGVKYLKKLLNQFGGDLELTLAAYNAGSTKVMEYQGVPPYKATRHYVEEVFKYYRHYQGA